MSLLSKRTGAPARRMARMLVSLLKAGAVLPIEDVVERLEA